MTESGLHRQAQGATSALRPSPPPVQAALRRYLSARVPGISAAEPLQLYQFSHGQSNPTYMLKVSGQG